MITSAMPSTNGKAAIAPIPQWAPGQDGDHRGRAGGGQCAAEPEVQFEPKIVANRQLIRVDELVISLSAKGLPHGEINTHLAEVYGSRCSFPGRRTGSREGRAGLLSCLLIIPAHDVALHHPPYSVAEKDCATMGLATCPFR
jgi:hypothetical protein